MGSLNSCTYPRAVGLGVGSANMEEERTRTRTSPRQAGLAGEAAMMEATGCEEGHFEEAPSKEAASQEPPSKEAASQEAAASLKRKAPAASSAADTGVQYGDAHTRTAVAYGASWRTYTEGGDNRAHPPGDG